MQLKPLSSPQVHAAKAFVKSPSPPLPSLCDATPEIVKAGVRVRGVMCSNAKMHDRLFKEFLLGIVSTARFYILGQPKYILHSIRLHSD